MSDQQTAVAVVDDVSPEILNLLRRGDVDGMVQALLDDPDATESAKLAVRKACKVAVELRRQSVAVIGDHDAFVRMTPAGSLYQVIKPVQLSLEEGTLYQIPVRRQVDGTWQTIVENPGQANVSYEGLLRLNAVAGCAVTQPATIIVDGVRQTNPYVQRGPGKNGRPGDIARIVIGIIVAGPAPATGNPVVVNYTLDYDPARELQQMLAFVAGGRDSDACYLIDEDQWSAMQADMDPRERFRWKFLPVYGGVGYAHDLRNSEVAKKYRDYIGILQNALKKAQTVARRNAMKSHPALAHHRCLVNAQGVARIPVLGWAGDDQSMKAWQDLVSRLAKGQDPRDLRDLEVAEVIDVEGKYDPEADVVGDGELDVIDVTHESSDSRRSQLVDLIDQAIDMLGLSPAAVQALHYDPMGPIADLEDLREQLVERMQKEA